MRTGVNIRKRKDGRYEARYPKGRDAAGKLLYGYCYGHSFEEAREKRDRIMAQRPREMNLLILGAADTVRSSGSWPSRWGYSGKSVFWTMT